ncbi:uncharacterized protein [Dysidea avara]|uniref:uncharacterized protein isoform X1 n=1 Tax=Dysidea avara TaxID=196820 RepID=UPI003318F508
MSLQIFIIITTLTSVTTSQTACSKVITTKTDGNDTEGCLEGDYPCSSLGYVLNHLQSNDCVNITSNSVPLTTIVELHNLNAITIRGQGNTIVMCNNTGGVSCNNCSNVVIEGITWDGCGDPQRHNVSIPYIPGGIQFSSVANLYVTNCTFQSSKIRAMSLLNTSGFVKIDRVKFLHNANYDSIICAYAQTGYIHCSTRDFISTGGLYIGGAADNTSINISNSIFNNNGHFGEIVMEKFMELPNDPEYSEIANGAALKVLVSNVTRMVAVNVEFTTFQSNRGRGGGAVNIYNLQIINLNCIEFKNNSLIVSYISGSALFVWFKTGENVTLPVHISVSSCVFEDNNSGRTVVSFFVYKASPRVQIENSTFTHNKDYGVGLVELQIDAESHSGMAEIAHSNFSSNNGNALVYLKLNGNGSRISMVNIQAHGNIGFSDRCKDCRGGFFVVDISTGNCTVHISKLHLHSNDYSSVGGGLYISGSLKADFKCFVNSSSFLYNVGRGLGTTIYNSLSNNSYLFAISHCTFKGNRGGESIVHIEKIANKEHSTAILLVDLSDFSDNIGTVIHLTNAVLLGNGHSLFQNNQANNGAGLLLHNSYILLNFFPFYFSFQRNLAYQRGGAVRIDLGSSQCHWLLGIHSLCTKHITTLVTDYLSNKYKSHFNSTTYHVEFVYNAALITGNTVFINVNSSILNNSTNMKSLFYLPKNFTVTSHTKHSPVVATQPQRVQLRSPAKCDEWYVCSIPDIMLGEAIDIPASLLGYNNEAAEIAEFIISCVSNCNGYSIEGDTLISLRNRFSGMSIVGREVFHKTTMSVELLGIGLDLNTTIHIELVPCRVGYRHNSANSHCECYTAKDVVSCTPRHTTIKRNFWFGVVSNATTVSVCPSGYCNFNRMEVSRGEFLLSPVQDDQCGPHRTGPACGNCHSGYTLSLDSVDCISTDKCSPGFVVLIIGSTIVYWMLVISVSFLLMLIMYRLKCNIGYLYGIVYFYSVADILLGQVLSLSKEASYLAPISGTIFKLYPGFLYKVCFVQGMRGIDQYAIHYVHPTVVILLLYLLSRFAKCSGRCEKFSRRFTNFISKAAIPTICLMLTLAYVSVADASLQLLRSIQFTDVDGIFTYHSPGMKYFTDRHILYFIIAMLYELAIVVGLPILLLSEPFVNHKINFTRINLCCTKLNLKPLLDQFQGCYKDKYRWFAGVYLISRQAILVIVVINFSDYYTELYLLMTISVIAALLHHFVQPYKSDLLNKYDAIILHILILVLSLQMVAFSNGFTSNTITGTAYALFMLPLMIPVLFLFWHFKLCKRSNSMSNLNLISQEGNNFENIAQNRCSHEMSQSMKDYQESLLNYMPVDDL